MAIGDPAQNPYEDRITQILQQRAQPQTFTPGARDAAAVASQYMAQAGQAQGVEQILQAIGAPQREQQQRELESATALYDLFEQKRAAGDAQANALFDRISMFTGGDPEGTKLFLEELNADPEEIDPGNAFQVMTKLAGIARRTGYQSPENRMQQLEIQRAEAELAPGAPEYVEIKDQPGFVRQKGTTQAIPIEGLPEGTATPIDVESESKLRKEFSGLQQVKDFREVETSFEKIKVAAANPSPANDLSLMNAYVRLVDPGSVVRPSEFETVAQASSLLERMGFTPSSIKAAIKGNKLTPRMRADFLSAARNLYSAQRKSYDQTVVEYRGLADQYGFDPDRISPVREQDDDDPLGIR